MEFANKTILVTGATTGIGFATANSFALRGARVLITGSDAQRVQGALERLGTNCDGIAADYVQHGTAGAIASFCRERAGSLDVMVLNAGICLTNHIESLDEAEFDREMSVNFRGAILTVSACLPLMKSGGSILFTTSVNDVIGVPGQLVYSASKAALRSAVRTLTAELAPRGIRVNAVAPGPIETPIFDKLAPNPEAAAKAKANEANLTVAQRIGQPEEIAAAFLFLAGADASYIRGVDLRVDGGWGDI
jgi:NAD(P)-dependent dehydrogenase (short-subunit alcohol dehydrogenase family)